jgi:hypothetical protein
MEASNFGPKQAGLRYWIMFCDKQIPNKKLTPIVRFLIFDRAGKRVAYGTGPVVEGRRGGCWDSGVTSYCPQ